MGTQQNRRTFLHDGSLVLLGAGLAPTSVASLLADESQREYGSAWSRTCTTPTSRLPAHATTGRRSPSSPKRLRSFKKDKPDFVVELGDLIDAADSVETEKKYLATINKEFAAICRATSTTSSATTASTRSRRTSSSTASARRSRTTRSTLAASTSSFSTPASVATASRTAGTTSSGTTPTFPASKSSGCGPTSRRRPARLSSSPTSGST